MSRRLLMVLLLPLLLANFVMLFFIGLIPAVLGVTLFLVGFCLGMDVARAQLRDAARRLVRPAGPYDPGGQ